MNKIVKAILSIFLIVVAIGSVIAVLWYTGKIEKKNIDNISVYRNETTNGLVYTEKEWTWKPIESKSIIQFVDDVTTPTKVVTLNIDIDTYVDVEIPDVEYFYDFGKTVWASDGSFLIRIMKDAAMDNLSALAGIDDIVSINKSTVCSADDVKGKKTIATLVNDVAIIADVYSGDEAYSIIRKSISNIVSGYTIEKVSYSDDMTKLTKLVYNGSYAPQYIPQEISLVQQRLLFEDGVFYSQSIVEPFYAVKDRYLKLISTFSKEPIQALYDDGVIVYAESGNYTVGLTSYNSNTTIVYIGEGEEARCNIISSLNYIK